MWSEEAGNVIGGNGMNQDNVTKFTALLNDLWDGKVHYVNRRTSENFTIEGRRFSCSLMMQPIIFDQLISRCNNVSRGNGFLPRCLIINPTSTMGERIYKEPPHNMPHIKIFDNRIYELLNKTLPLDDNQRLIPEILYLSPEAKSRWIEFYNEVEAELRKDGEFSTIKDFASKAAENAARMAGVFHVFGGDDTNLVSAENMQRAIGIMAWHLQEIKRLMGACEKSPEQQNAELLLKWLLEKTHTEIKLTDVLQYAPNVLRDKDKRDAAINLLIMNDYLEFEEKEDTKYIKLTPKALEAKNG